MANTINVNQNNNNVSLEDNNRKIIVTDNRAGTTIDVTQPVTSIVTVSSLGPQGPQGPAGEIPSTGSFVLTSSFNLYTGSSDSQFAGTASFAVTASYAANVPLTASYALQALSASYAISASYEIIKEVSSSHADFADTASLAYTASYALTASYLDNYIEPFPYTGSAQITGSLGITGSLSVSSSTITGINLQAGRSLIQTSPYGVDGEIFLDTNYGGFDSSLLYLYSGSNGDDYSELSALGSSGYIGLYVNNYNTYFEVDALNNQFSFIQPITSPGKVQLISPNLELKTGVGVTNTFNSTSSFVVGQNNTLTGTYLVAIGEGNTVSGYNAVAIGFDNQSTGDHSVSQGTNNQSTGFGSHAEGTANIASGDYSHAEGGKFNHAIGNLSHAEGEATKAIGIASHAEGTQTTSSGNYSHAEGYNTIASGSTSHAEGEGSITIGRFSHAEGSYTIVSGRGSHAEGLGTIASGSYQHAQGKFNTHGNTTSLMIIGNGSSDGSRSDLALFNTDGIVFNQPLTGSIISGSFIGDGSGLTGVISSSYALTASYALQALSASYAISASYEIIKEVSSSHADFADTASLAYTASSADQFNIRTALTASGIIYPTTDGDNGDIIFTDGAGNLSFGRTTVFANVKNISGGTLQKGTPVHVTGSVGNANEIIAASASLSNTMPAHFILNEELDDDQEGLAIAIGFINGVNTSLFMEGDIVYVGADGGYTNVKPTGSNLIQNLGIVTKVAVNGSGYVLGAGRSNDVPNISSGYFWVGNADQVATPTPTSSIQNVVSSSYALTASYIDGGFY